MAVTGWTHRGSDDCKGDGVIEVYQGESNRLRIAAKGRQALYRDNFAFDGMQRGMESLALA